MSPLASVTALTASSIAASAACACIVASRTHVSARRTSSAEGGARASSNAVSVPSKTAPTMDVSKDSNAPRAEAPGPDSAWNRAETIPADACFGHASAKRARHASASHAAGDPASKEWTTALARVSRASADDVSSVSSASSPPNPDRAPRAAVRASSLHAGPTQHAHEHDAPVAPPNATVGSDVASARVPSDASANAPRSPASAVIVRSSAFTDALVLGRSVSGRNEARDAMRASWIRARMIARSSAARLEDVAYITAPATHSSSVATTRFLDPECSPEPHRPRAGPARARASSRRNASFGTSRGIASALRETRTIVRCAESRPAM